ncbi:lambda-exonuclease family protein [Pseudomonas sp. GOM6]|uniref:lambda-exonuclease family protein n=1 Tax=Pseudomonas sp. GOM6 TaxID=3036944 RepID=UPI00240A6FE7|nr:YqaJ viral recombinase family protein [Pseudomonas sp. GOM6]MDG1580873.1 YqaJ viral recombinase family protein [Pseudomonas sp. GOM6]
MAMRVVDLRQRTPQWHAWRKNGVTATSAAVVLGENPDKTVWRLWAEQTGKITPPDLSVIPQVRLAILLESHALAWFQDRYDMTLLPLCAESSEHPEIRASFDGVNEYDEPVEIKVLSDRNFLDVSDMGEESFHYKLYWWQVQHQLYVTEASKGYLLFYHSRLEPIVFVIQRDDAAIKKMVAAELAYFELVRKGKEPGKDKERDYFQPEGADHKKWVDAAMQLRNLEAQRLELMAQVDGIVGQQNQLQKLLLSMMGDHMLADFEGVRMTRYKQAGRVSWRKIVELLDPDFKTSKYPNHVSGDAERVRMTLDDAPMSEATLDYELSGIASGADEFCC